MAEGTRKREDSGLASLLDELPLDRLKDELQGALVAVTERATEVAADKVSDLTDRLVDVASNGGVTTRALTEGGKAAASGGSPLLGALKGGVMGVVDKAKDAVTGGGGGGSGKSGGKPPTKATNIVEQIDVGVPVHVAYNQWTQFQDYSGFMKKVDKVEQKSDEKVDFKAQIFWSHRTWEATILEQVPDKLIVWHSKGPKGHVDGSVTFHELAPELTRILVDLVYYPQGLFERTGNIWRAQGRRARLELKHFRRHVMTEVIRHPDDLEGWRGEIHDGKVERTHEDALEDESDEYDEDEESEDDYDEEPEDEYEDEEPEDESEDEYDEEPEDESDEYDEDEEPEDEYDEEPEDESDEYDEDEEPEDEYDEEPEDESDEYDEDEEPEDESEDEYDEEPEDEYEDEEPEGESDEYDEDEEPEDEYDEEPDERSHRRAS